MWDDKTWRYEQAIPSDVPDDYKQHALEQAKREVGLRLYGILEQMRLPAVVDLIEEIEKFPELPYLLQKENWYPRGACDKIKIQLRITPVQYQRITMPKIEAMELAAWMPPKSNIWKRIKWLLKGW